MKIYKDNEIIKAAKYRQTANDFLSRMESEGDVKIEKVVVDGNLATFHYKGVREGHPISFEIPVKRNHCEEGIKCNYGGHINEFDFHYKYFDREDFDIWLNSTMKLDTEEAKAGTLPMLVEDWLTIPGNKEFYEKVKEAVLPYTRFKEHLDADSFITMPQHKDWFHTASSIVLPVLVYNFKINDFSLARDMDELQFDFGITSRHTVYVMYSDYGDNSRKYNLFRQMFPELTKRQPGTCKTHCYIETNLETALSIISSARERLYKIYDEVAKSHGMSESWRKAKSWTKNGPVYPNGTDEAERLNQKQTVNRDTIIDKHIKGIKDSFKREYNAEISDYFPDAEFLRETEDWCLEYPDSNCFVAFLSIPYKFPKIKGAKVAWQRKLIKARLEYNARNYRFTVKYTGPFKFTVMCGDHDWFCEAKKRDDEKMMIIQTARTKHCELGSSGFKHIKQHLDEIPQFVEYKGFKCEG